MSTKLDGAQAGIVDVRPSIDLAWLMGHAKDALETALHNNPGMIKVARKDGFTFIFNTVPFLQALLANDEIRSKSGDAFLRDVVLPKTNKTLKIGGRLSPGTEASLKGSVRKIADLADATITKAFEAAAIQPSQMWVQPGDVAPYLRSVAEGLGSRFQPDASLRVARLRFEETATARRSDEVARQITSFEEVEEGNRLTQIMAAIGRYFVMKRRQDEEEVEADAEAWVAGGKLPGSYADQLINFLDDEGLSRVRLAVSFRIMRALADAADEAGGHDEFVRYVRRLDDIFKRLVETKTGFPRIDLVSVFGTIGDFDLGDVMAKASFIRRLPIWTVWDSQLFERRSQESGDSGVQREVCYNFRANGHNPSENLSSYLARVENAEDMLKGEDVPPYAVSALAELLVYDAALRRDESDPLKVIEERCEALRKATNRQEAVASLVSDLKAKDQWLDRIAQQMVDVLRRKGTDRKIAAITREPITFFVNITDDVVNKNSVGAGLEHPFVQVAEDEERKVKWLQALRITSGTSHSAANQLFSFKVTVELGDRSLLRDAEPVEAKTQRASSAGRVALLNLLPMGTKNEDLQESVYELARSWRAGRNAITFLYDPQALACEIKPRKAPDPRAVSARMLSIRTAFLAVVQILADTLIRAMKPDRGSDRLILYRQQYYPKSKDGDGWAYSSEAIFTISQALEHALGKRLTVKLQGSVASKDASSPRRRMKAYDAIMSTFDLAVQGLGEVPTGKVGVVSFASRPCDVDESKTPTDRDTYVVAGRVYLLEGKGAGHVIRRRPNILDTYEGTDVVTNPSVVKEAVQDLVNEGCKHIVMMAHKYSGRAIGRSAERHRHHENASFLTGLASSFPGVTFHPVVKDTMKVVRLSDSGGKDRIGFEVVGREAHAERLIGDNMKKAFNKEGLIPFYSLATLHVVGTGDARGQRPQSGITTYYLLKPDSVEGLDILIGSVGLLTTDSPEHKSVVAAIRGIHLIESEEGAMRGVMKPVLQPAAWMSPVDINGAGEIKALDRTRRSRGSVEISLTALAATISRVMKSLPAKEVGAVADA